jgi:hypothetical protein
MTRTLIIALALAIALPATAAGAAAGAGRPNGHGSTLTLGDASIGPPAGPGGSTLEAAVANAVDRIIDATDLPSAAAATSDLLRMAGIQVLPPGSSLAEGAATSPAGGIVVDDGQLMSLAMDGQQRTSGGRISLADLAADLHLRSQAVTLGGRWRPDSHVDSHGHHTR